MNYILLRDVKALKQISRILNKMEVKIMKKVNSVMSDVGNVHKPGAFIFVRVYSTPTISIWTLIKPEPLEHNTPSPRLSQIIPNSIH